jgi:hypothetical protein
MMELTLLPATAVQHSDLQGKAGNPASQRSRQDSMPRGRSGHVSGDLRPARVSAGVNHNPRNFLVSIVRDFVVTR